MIVVEDGDLPRAVCHEDEKVGLVESRHFHIRVSFEIHCAGETGDVPVAGLLHHGEQVEEGVPGSVEGHGAIFIFMKYATAADGFGFGDDKRMRRK